MDVQGQVTSNLTVQYFVQSLSQFNDLIEYTPFPNLINDPGVQTPKFTDAELASIIKNACPAAWKKAQVLLCVCNCTNT
jgi:hypothetical protein